MITFYFVYYVHDDYAGDTTLWRCLKDFESAEDASKWGADMRGNVLSCTSEKWENPPLGFDPTDLNSVELTIQPHEQWITQLRAKADEIAAFVPEDDEDDDEEDSEDADQD